MDTATIDHTARILERNKRFEYFLLLKKRTLENELAGELAADDPNSSGDLLLDGLWQSDSEPLSKPRATAGEVTSKTAALHDEASDDAYEPIDLGASPQPPGALPGQMPPVLPIDLPRRAAAPARPIPTPPEASVAEDQPTGPQQMGEDVGENWEAYFAVEAEPADPPTASADPAATLAEEGLFDDLFQADTGADLGLPLSEEPASPKTAADLTEDWETGLSTDGEPVF
jgi:hypothetical protein